MSEGQGSCLYLQPQEHPSPPKPDNEIMQIDYSHLSLAERHGQLSQGLCLYCGQKGHVKQTCCFCPFHPVVSVASFIPIISHPLTTNVQLTMMNQCITVKQYWGK